MEPASIDICIKWNKNKLVNPRTGKIIKHNGPTYLQLEKECKKILEDHFRPKPSQPSDLKTITPVDLYHIATQYTSGKFKNKYNLIVELENLTIQMHISVVIRMDSTSKNVLLEVLSDNNEYPCFVFDIKISDVISAEIYNILYDSKQGINPDRCKLNIINSKLKLTKKISWSELFINIAINIATVFNVRFINLTDLSFIRKCNDTKVSLTKFLHMQGKQSIYERTGFIKINMMIYNKLNNTETFEMAKHMAHEHHQEYISNLTACQLTFKDTAMDIIKGVNENNEGACQLFNKDSCLNPSDDQQYALIF